MIKLFKIFLVSFIFLGMNSNLKAETGAATVYKITMKKIELCESSTGVDDCVGAESESPVARSAFLRSHKMKLSPLSWTI